MKKKHRFIIAVLISCLTLVGLIGTAYADQPRDIGYFSNITVAANSSWTGSTRRYRSDVVIDYYSMCRLTAYSGTLKWQTQYKDPSTGTRYNALASTNTLTGGYNYSIYNSTYYSCYGPDYPYVLRFNNTSNSSSTVSGEWGP